MAPALTSYSCLLTTTPRIRNRTAAPRAAFRFGQSKDEPETTQTGGGLVKPTPFRFDFGKLPDVKSLIPVLTNPGSSGLGFDNTRRKDPGTVFVAGATGQVGIRIAQTLLQKGFSVRAGVPDLGSAQDLARLAATYKIISKEEARKLNAVESAFQDAESIARAIGNASKVVVTVSQGENGPESQVSALDALLVVQAAGLAGVRHVAIVYDSGLDGGSSTYNVLDGITSFFGNLFAKTQPLTLPEFLEKVVETDVAYTLIKTSLAEDYSPESLYNIKVSAEGSTGGPDDYKVAKFKIASLVADVFSNTAVAENKVVEVSTDPSAPSRSIDELFSVVPEDGRRKAYAEAVAKAKAAEEEAMTAAADKASEEEAKAPISAENAKDTSGAAAAAGVDMDGLLAKAKDFGSTISWEKLGSQFSAAVNENVETARVQVATVRGQAKARNLPPKKAVMKQGISKPVSALKRKEEKPDQKEEKKKEVRNVFGGLFKQETIYVDDD